MLFDIGIAGPIAGFVGRGAGAVHRAVACRTWHGCPARLQRLELGEPLLFKLASRLIWGTVPDGYSINMHPIAFAAWFGLLATALNLVPRRSARWRPHLLHGSRPALHVYVTLAMVACAIALSYFSTSWIVWTVLMVLMLTTFGPRHPPTIDEDVPLDRTRLVLAFVALAMFVLCFTPAPISPFDLIGR